MSATVDWELTRNPHTHLVRKDRWRLSDSLVKATSQDRTSFAMPARLQLTIQELDYLRNSQR